MKAKCQITEIAWDGIIPALLAHKIDVIFASMSITDERKKTIAFSLPYYDTPVVVVAPKAEPLDPTNLAGKTIGVQIGTVEADWLKKYYTGKATIKTYQTQDESNADLLAGRTDLMVLDGIAAATFVQSSAASGMEIKATLAHDPLFGAGVGAGLRQGDTALKAKLDAAILAVRKDGAYDALDKKYFGAVSIWPPASEFK
jgi:polar amino acid transport system substrate-binding protein